MATRNPYLTNPRRRGNSRFMIVSLALMAAALAFLGLEMQRSGSRPTSASPAAAPGHATPGDAGSPQALPSGEANG